MFVKELSIFKCSLEADAEVIIKDSWLGIQTIRSMNM